MKKNEYMAPEMEIIELKSNVTLLSASSGEASGNGQGEEPPAGGL